MEVTKDLSEFVVSTDFDDLPLEVISEAKLCFLDWLAVTLAGAIDPEINSLVDVVKLVGGEEQASVLGRNFKTSILNATLINGMSSHVFDYDDTSVEFLGHPSVTLFPCLLALSEWEEKTGKDFLGAYVVGFELGCRVALGATPRHYLGGWHGTSTIGHFSSTAASAKLLGLSKEQLIYAFGTAGTQAAGIKAVFGTSCKPFHAGKAGFNGLLSALLTQRGFTSVENILEGEKCFWDVFSMGWSPKKAMKDLGKKWHILGNKYKFHASCYGTHAPIEAVLALKNEYNLDPKKIENIDINVAPPTLEIAGNTHPINALEGKFSIPYSVANALLREYTGIEAFTDEKVNDLEIIKLRDKINLIPDNKVPPFKTEVTIYIEGKKYEKKLNILQQVVGFEEKKKKIQEKLRSLVNFNFNFNRERIEEIIRKVENLEQETNMLNIVKLLI